MISYSSLEYQNPGYNCSDGTTWCDCPRISAYEGPLTIELGKRLILQLTIKHKFSFIIKISFE